MQLAGQLYTHTLCQRCHKIQLLYTNDEITDKTTVQLQLATYIAGICMYQIMDQGIMDQQIIKFSCLTTVMRMRLLIDYIIVPHHSCLFQLQSCPVAVNWCNNIMAVISVNGYWITGNFPQVQIFLNGEPLALTETIPIQKFTSPTTENIM